MQTTTHVVSSLYSTTTLLDLKTSANKKPDLKNKLFSLYKKNISTPLLPAIKLQRLAIQELFFHADQHLSPTTIATIFDQTIRIFISMGEMTYARDACYTQIQTFIHAKQLGVDKDKLNYLANPWLQLIRMDRLEGNYPAANRKLNILMRASKNDEINERSLLQQLFYADEEVAKHVTMRGLVESLKLFLEAGHYEELIQFENAYSSTYFLNLDIFCILQEALAIALANSGRVKEAAKILSQLKSTQYIDKMYIISLREYELKSLFSDRQCLERDRDNLYQLTLVLLSVNPIEINKIYFALHTAHLMYASGLKTEVIKLLYFCLEVSQYMNDEVLKAHCLVMLYKVIEETEGRKLIENMMVEHYFTTQYVEAKALMHQCFPDLQHVESKCYDEVLRVLFDDLLAFSNFILG